VIVIHDELLSAPHSQPGSALTVTMPVPPAREYVASPGEIATAQAAVPL
jgi:hypothetical protein